MNQVQHAASSSRMRLHVAPTVPRSLCHLLLVYLNEYLE